jgi:hypothetical protein
MLCQESLNTVLFPIGTSAKLFIVNAYATPSIRREPLSSTNLGSLMRGLESTSR